MTVQPAVGFATPAEPVAVGAVQPYLTELWQRLMREQPAGMPLAPARMLNLVIYGEEDSVPETAERLVGLVAARHPGRLIAVRLAHGQAGAEIAAEVSIRCTPDPTGRRQVCSELILLTVPAALRRYVPHAVCALLQADRPVVLWWPGAPDMDDPLYQRLTAAVADRVLLDSRAGDPLATLRALARWCAESSRAALGDLAWARLQPWRQAVAGFFDPPNAVPPPAQIRRAELMSGGGALSVDALLLLGWLAARLGWQVTEARQEPDAVQVDFACAGAGVAVRCTRAADEASAVPVLTAVRLHVSQGAEAFTCEAHRGHDANVVHTHVTPPGGPRSARSAGLAELPDEALVARLLDTPLPDPLYAAALERAVTIADALA